MTPAQTSGYKKVVLIETYWNVKFVKIVDKTADHMVLIETYWNVKFSVIG